MTQETNIYKDKYGYCLHEGDIVAFASKGVHNRPYLNEGVIIGFSFHPSFVYVDIKTTKHRKTRKNLSEVIKINVVE